MNLKVVRIEQGKSLAAWESCHPLRSVPWQVHPGHEVHHVAATASALEPGDLVLAGPNLPTVSCVAWPPREGWR